MACPSFSLPAGVSCPALHLCVQKGKEHGDDAICARCYARRGRYRFSNVRRSQTERWNWWQETPPDKRADFIVMAIQMEGAARYFRCYDSGDLDSPAACETWIRVAEQLPYTIFWIPTHTWMIPEMLPSLRELARVPNVHVRPSAVCFDDPPPVVEGLDAGHTAHRSEKPKADRICPGKCGQCRMCWTRPDLSVSFKEH